MKLYQAVLYSGLAVGLAGIITKQFSYESESRIKNGETTQVTQVYETRGLEASEKFIMLGLAGLIAGLALVGIGKITRGIRDIRKSNLEQTAVGDSK